MATAAVDELFDWLKKLDDSNKGYRKKKSALREEMKLLEKSMRHLDKLMEREVDIKEVISNAINSTPLEDVIRHASKKGFTPSYYPDKIPVNEIKHIAEKLESVDCNISFSRPAVFEPEMIEKTIDFSTYCMDHSYHICNFTDEGKMEFQMWMVPIRYVLHGPIVHYTDEKGKEQSVDIRDALNADFLKTVDTTLKDKPEERLIEARKLVKAGLKTSENFGLGFNLEKDGSFQTYNEKGFFDGLRIGYPCGYAMPCNTEFPLLKDGEKYSKEGEPIWGGPDEVCKVLISRIDEYDSLLEKAHRKEGYRFGLASYVEMQLEFNKKEF